MPDDNDIPPPAGPPVLFRMQSVRGVPELDQVAEDRNELVRSLVEQIRDAGAAAAEQQQDAFQRLLSAVADFNQGEHRHLAIDVFRARLADMIDEIVDEEDIEFQHNLNGGGPAPGGP